MWSLSYMENGEIKVKRFKSDKEADEWIYSKNDDVDFTTLTVKEIRDNIELTD